MLSTLMGATERVYFCCPEDEFWHIWGRVRSGSGLTTVTACGTTGTGSGHCFFSRPALAEMPGLFRNSSLCLCYLLVILKASKFPCKWATSLLLSLLKCLHHLCFCMFAFMDLLQSKDSDRANEKASRWLNSGRHFPVSLESLLTGPGS